MCLAPEQMRVRTRAEEPEPRNKPFGENIGNSALAGVTSVAAKGWAGMEMGAETLSTLLTGPLARMRILPEDPMARAVHVLREKRRQMQQVTDQIMPKQGRDYAVDPNHVPAPARPFIEQWLQRKGFPAHEANVREVWRNRNTDLLLDMERAGIKW